MAKELTLTAENIRKAMADAEAKAATVYATAFAMRQGMEAEGINPMADKEAFDKLDEAFKGYDLEKSNVLELRGRLDRLTEIEGFSRPGPSRPYGGAPREQAMTPGRRFLASEGYKHLEQSGAFTSEAAFMSQGLRGFERPVTIMELDELQALLRAQGWLATTVTGGGSTSAGPFILQELMPGFVGYLRKIPSVAAIVGQGTTNSDVVEYVTQTAVTNAAAETAEDSAAPAATYAFATNTTNVREITHYVPVTLRAMADYGQIRTIIENELVTDVLDKLDDQVASGAGSGVTLTGIYNASGIGSQARGADTALDAVHKAITVIRSAAGVLLEADYIGMHPADWEKVRLAKDAQGQYLMGPAGMNAERQIWGVPVIVSKVFTSGTPLVGNFARSATLWLREGLSVTTGLDGNDFTTRRVSILAALRIAFAVTRATGFCQVTGF